MNPVKNIILQCSRATLAWHPVFFIFTQISTWKWATPFSFSLFLFFLSKSSSETLFTKTKRTFWSHLKQNEARSPLQFGRPSRRLPDGHPCSRHRRGLRSRMHRWDSTQTRGMWKSRRRKVLHHCLQWARGVLFGLREKQDVVVLSCQTHILHRIKSKSPAPRCVVQKMNEKRAFFLELLQAFRVNYSHILIGMLR